jgi:hypothetical protein
MKSKQFIAMKAFGVIVAIEIASNLMVSVQNIALQMSNDLMIINIKIVSNQEAIHIRDHVL